MFSLQLARDLGMTLRDLLKSMSVRELSLWIAFYEHSPPDESANMRTANIMAAIYNASGNLKRGTTAKAKDFMPRKKKQKQLSVEESIAILKAQFGE
jgi:hypothetical protein